VGLAGELPAWSCAREFFVLPVEAVVVFVLPGKALAATSERTPVRATLPAISQRLTRESLLRAASRVWVLCKRMSISVVEVVGVKPGAELGDHEDREHGSRRQHADE
jgi:hypothetical protein